MHLLIRFFPADFFQDFMHSCTFSEELFWTRRQLEKAIFSKVKNQLNLSQLRQK